MPIDLAAMIKLMIVVIIAGGSGTRLWPLSTPVYPKHLLQVDNDQYTILQNTYRRAKNIASSIYVVSERSHAHYVKDQLNDLAGDHLLIEPDRKGTANCILAALVKLKDKEDINEPVAFIHADHFVRDVNGFVYSFKLAAVTSEQAGKIVLVGVEPTYAATGFGYIEKADLLSKYSPVYRVSSFKEKPDYETAQAYLKSGNYLWNGGYFVGSISTFDSTIRRYAPKLYSTYQELLDSGLSNFDKIYLKLDNESIDYALIEKVKDLLVVSAGFDWMDLGSFADLYKAVEKDRDGNYRLGKTDIDETTNCFIQNNETKPLAVIGLDNCIVINTPAGMLVARKDLSQKVGESAKRLMARDGQ